MFKNFFSRFSTTNIDKSPIKRRYDDFINVATGLNTARDRVNRTQISKSKKLSYNEIDTLIRDNGIAKKICMKPAEEMTRELLCIEGEDAEIFHSFLINDDWNFYDLFKLAIFWEYAFGGAVIMLDINDGKELREPVDEDSLTEDMFGKNIVVLDKSFIMTDNYNPFKKTEVYYINIQGLGTTYIHESRLLIFEGNAATINERQENQGFSDGVLQDKKSAVRHYTTAHDKLAIILENFSQTVFKIKGLNDAMGDPVQEEQLIKKFLTINMSLGLLPGMALDTEDDFNRITATLTGIKDIFTIFKDFLIALTNFPHSILTGEKPEGGIGDNGKSQLITWYDFISNLQKRITPKWRRLLRYYAKAKKKSEPKFTYKNLWQMDQKESAEILKSNADSLIKIMSGIKLAQGLQLLTQDNLQAEFEEKTKDGPINVIVFKIKQLISSLKPAA
jgi:phage-related protein (TIGR01555 family)